MIWALGIQSQFNRKLSKAARKAGPIQSKGHYRAQQQWAPGTVMQEQLLRGAMWPGDGAIHPLMDGPSYISWGGGGLPVPELFEKQAGPL